MAKYLAVKDVIVKVDGTVFGCLKSMSIKVDRAMKDITCAATQAEGDWKEQLPGQLSWGASVAGVQRLFTEAQEGAEVTYDSLFDAIKEGALITLEYSHAVTGFAGKRYSGDAYISGLTWDRPETDEVTWSAELVGNGPLDRLAAGAI